jgi:hypothetical protein
MHLTRRAHRIVLTSKRARLAIVSLFAMFALALCMFAMSTVSEHQPSASSHPVAAAAQQPVSVSRSAHDAGSASPSMGSVESSRTSPPPQCDSACDSHTAFTAADCALVVVLFGFALLAFGGGPLLGMMSRLRAMLCAVGTLRSLSPPSLVSLSISRT